MKATPKNDMMGKPAADHLAEAGLAGKPVEASSHVMTTTVPRANESQGEIIILTEKLMRLMPKEGATLLLGSLSPVPGDKPVLAVQLARTLATMTSKAVLLLDFTSAVSDGAETAGLLDILRGTTALAQALHPTETAAVEILGRGADGNDATELLISDSFRGFLEVARAQFPWVLINCHSLLRHDNSTAMLLVSRADAVLATLKRGQGRGRDVLALSEFCREMKSDFLGVVLT